MNRFLFASAVAGALVLGAATQAQAQVVCFGSLQGSQENPPVQSAAKGLVTITVSSAMDSITLVAQVFNFDVTTITASHVHHGVAGVNGPVVSYTSSYDPTHSFSFMVGDGSVFDAANPFAVANFWGGDHSAADPAVVDPNFTQIAQWAANGELYFNIHTAANPGGEARAQLTCL